MKDVVGKQKEAVQVPRYLLYNRMSLIRPAGHRGEANSLAARVIPAQGLQVRSARFKPNLIPFSHC